MTQAKRDVAAFLRGDRVQVGQIRTAIESVVRSFQFTDGDLDRDLVQEVLGRLLQNLTADRFRGDSSFKTYAQRVARYACLEHLRRRRHEVSVDFEALPSRARWSEPEGALLSMEEHRRNLEIFTGLPGESRELLRLIFIDELSYAEIARKLGISEGAVKSRVHKIRLSCREAVGAGRSPAPRRAPERVEE